MADARCLESQQRKQVLLIYHIRTLFSCAVSMRLCWCSCYVALIICSFAGHVDGSACKTSLCHNLLQLFTWLHSTLTPSIWGTCCPCWNCCASCSAYCIPILRPVKRGKKKDCTDRLSAVCYGTQVWYKGPCNYQCIHVACWSVFVSIMGSLLWKLGTMHVMKGWQKNSM